MFLLLLFWLRGCLLLLCLLFSIQGQKSHIGYTVSYTHKWHIVNKFVTDKSNMCLKKKIKWFTPNLSDIVLKKIFSSSKCNVSHLILTIPADMTFLWVLPVDTSSFIIISSFSNFHQCRVLFYRRLRILNQQLRERERQEKEGLDPKIQVESKLSIVNTSSISVSSILSWLGLPGQITLCLSVCHCLAWSLSDCIMFSFLCCKKKSKLLYL